MRGRPSSRRGGTALAAALCATGCANGVDQDEVPQTSVPEPSTAVDTGVLEDSAPPVLPPWLSDPGFEAGVPDSGQNPSPGLDGTDSTPPASRPDAARPAAPTRTSDAGTRTSDAGARTPSTGSGGSTRCQASSCTNECSLAGPLRCCSEQGRCGCTWAPGAYCL